ncbi:membrane dipeptidase (Peptidase family m19) domain-containing protein [Ditylenchus destructor]|uniref:Dipeptidase n=1 Tax=Ditylenchus destructor TaxID=166010 RepID=A0AAD4MFU1_9BILA|nr:membrane dipeptidase (Peptidase family m19) domain-containing protein [Ditylenchus destructor]
MTGRVCDETEVVALGARPPDGRCPSPSSRSPRHRRKGHEQGRCDQAPDRHARDAQAPRQPADRRPPRRHLAVEAQPQRSRESRPGGSAPADRGQCRASGLLLGHQDPKNQNYDANGADSDNITMLAVAQLQPPRTWTSLLERSLFHAQKLDRAAAASDGKLRVIRTPADLDALLAARAGKPQPVGGLLSIEGLQNMEGKLANIDRLHAAGFRMAGLTHFFDNELAGSMHGIAKGGLTPLGRQTVRRMEQLGMVVDIAHASHKSVAEILAMAKRPVVSSHGGVQAVCKVNRNLSDEEIRGVAKTGGVVGIGYWDAAICGTEPERSPRRSRMPRTSSASTMSASAPTSTARSPPASTPPSWSS